MGRLAKAVHVLVALASQSVSSRSPWRLGPSLSDALSDDARRLPRGDLLRLVEVDHLAGAPDELRSTGFVDFCSLPARLETAGQAVQLLLRALELAKASVRRSREASVAHRLALETFRLWDSELADGGSAHEVQRQGMILWKATLDLASLYAFCWQSLERTERSMDSERLLCVAQMLCIFDALLRRQVENGSLLAELFREDGGVAFHVGLCCLADQEISVFICGFGS
eukprot:s1247_g12.t1